MPVKKILSILVLPMIFFFGCSEEKKDEPVGPESTAKVSTCEGCHTNYTHLKAVHTPDPPSTGGGGCGGETPHIEPYDRVFLGGQGFTHFKTTMHGS
jgi:hypothetical protein